MLQLKPISVGRELDLSPYGLPRKQPRQKSCFIDRNRVDTVKPSAIDKNKDQGESDESVGYNKDNS